MDGWIMTTKQVWRSVAGGRDREADCDSFNVILIW